MKNLESLLIQWDVTKVQDFQFIMSALQGLGSCLKLKEMVVHFNSDGKHRLHSNMEQIKLGQLKYFFDTLMIYCPNILRLEVKENTQFGKLLNFHLSLIPSLTKLEELILTDLSLYPYMDESDNEVFLKTQCQS